MKEEVTSVFREFHQYGKFVKILTTSFVVLILKKGGIGNLKDFRKISLQGNIHKLLA